MTMHPFEYSEPRSVEEAVGQLSERRVAKAGGIDLLDLMKEGLENPERLVSLRRVPGLGAVEATPEGDLRVGARVTLAQIAEHPDLNAKAKAFAQAAAHAATPQIRNMATIGGNLLQRPRCWYFRSFDFYCKKNGGMTCFAQNGRNEYHALFHNLSCAMVHPSTPSTALLALDAAVELSGPKGRRVVPMDEFFVLPDDDIDRENVRASDELVTAILVPSEKSRSSAYIKQGEKASFDWPIADVAVALDLKGGKVERARVVLGAAAPAPYRAKEAERRLTGRAVTEAVAAEAAEAALSGANPLEHNRYKLAVFRAVTRRAILRAAA